ncbi:unnamed protein product [Timema podura]|uniref:EF-hand domain-containing protein n=1 Tax=Timema podura TaxID=61482 RepID=A0ABN7P635_TIMPD|nr:unnamed protein product [Timema podura]
MAVQDNEKRVKYGRSAGYLKRAKTEKLHEVFLKFASKEVNGEKFMTAADFVQNYLGIYSDANFNPESVKLLAGIVDTSKDGLISFAEFQAFEGLLCVPDALYKTAFQLFDTNGNGMVAFEEFAEVIRKTVIHQKIPFNLDGTFVQLYFGKEKKRLINYAEFSQFLHDFHEEYAMEAFRRHDKLGTGFISALDFQDIMISIKSHLLTKEVRENLVAAAGGGHGGRRVSFPFFMAFNSLLNNMELIKRIYLNATNGTRSQEVTKGLYFPSTGLGMFTCLYVRRTVIPVSLSLHWARNVHMFVCSEDSNTCFTLPPEEFLHSAQMMSQITPLEVDILFLLCDLLHQTG